MALAWDRFLEGSQLGQFQQSARWARVKAREGWSVERLFLDGDGPEQGGVQLLWRVSRLGRIGYVSKGPVVPGDEPERIAAVLDRLECRLRELRLRAIILQPPDESGISARQLICRGYSAMPIPSVITATAEIDVSGGREVVLAQMARKTRREARHAAEKGASVRLGGREDLRLFFELMLGSCRRQNVVPNPSRLDLVEALWDEFQPTVRVGFACAEGHTVAAVLLLGHGSRLFVWKKGWNSAVPRLGVNTYLNFEALNWASEWGYRTVDFVAMDPAIADTMLAGRELSQEQQRSRDMFHIRLGAKPRRLPPARLFIVNPILRRLFRWAGKWPALEAAILARTGMGG